MDSTVRLQRTRDWMREQSLDTIVATDTSNVMWLTGFESVFDYEQAHVALVTPESALLFTDSRYSTAALDAAADTPWEVVLELDDRAKAVAARALGAGARRIGFEDTMSVATWAKYAAAIGADGEMVETSDAVRALRAIKEPSEIAAIRAAQAITDAAFLHMVEWMAPGIEERLVALELERWMREQGSEGVAFDAIIASGPNSALPHATPGSRQLAKGDLVVLDFGARVGGYRSDMTRTVGIGSVGEVERAIYDVVRAANEAVLAMLRAGVTGKEADAAARDLIVAAGYGEFFQHGLGHGVGLDIHELPNLSPRNEHPLPSGAVVTVEPGIYLPGRGGVRIEDLVVVLDDRVENLTTSTKEFVEI